MAITLSKAIELQELEFADPGSIDPADLIEAQRLGVEAMKCVKECRQGDPQQIDNLLPSETKE